MHALLFMPSPHWQALRACVPAGGRAAHWLLTRIHWLLTRIHGLLTRIHGLLTTRIHGLLTRIHGLLTRIHGLLTRIPKPPKTSGILRCHC